MDNEKFSQEVAFISNNSQNTKPIGLMLVEDPEETLDAICNLEDNKITWDLYKKKYQSIKNLKGMGKLRNVDSKRNIDVHFYFLTTFSILIPDKNQKGLYFLSENAKKMCEYRKNEETIPKFQELLSEFLLNNERKGSLFIEFLKFIEIKRKRDEIFEVYKRPTAKTLIAWTKAAGMIIEFDKKIQMIPLLNREINEGIFWEALKNAYYELNRTNFFGLKKIFISIDELRFKLCTDLGISRYSFDNFLKKLLEDNELGNLISIQGAITSKYSKDDYFRYQNRKYFYLSLKV